MKKAMEVVDDVIRTKNESRVPVVLGTPKFRSAILAIIKT
jgi:hypothetical protein